jgi:hypothetical protein
MNKKTKSIGIALVAILVAGVSQATLVYSNDFESYTAGNLVGQDSWATSGGAPSPRVTTGVGSNTSKVLGATTSTATTANAYQDVSLGLGSYTSGTFSVDFYRGAGGTTTHKMYAGFGYSVSNSSGIAIYSTSGNLQIRDGASTGTFYTLRDSAGATVVTDFAKWMRVTVELDFQNNLITGVYAQNLESLVTKQLYFDSSGQQATKSYLVDETNWDRAYARTGLSTDNVHFMDNLSLSAIPEPATIGMLGLGALITLLVRRKLMF